jgi:predicted transcriptional regulator
MGLAHMPSAPILHEGTRTTPVTVMDATHAVDRSQRTFRRSFKRSNRAQILWMAEVRSGLFDVWTILTTAQGTIVGALSLRLPESLHRKLSEVAEREGVSINQLISSAVAEKMSALMTEEYLAARAKRASRRKFEAVLAKVPGVEPAESDRMLPNSRKAKKKTG